MTCRATIVTAITWSLLIPILGLPVVAFFLSPVCLIWNADVLFLTSAGVVSVWLILMWVYFASLRVTLSESHLTKSSWLRSTSVPLNEDTLIRHRAEHISIEGINLSAALSGILSQEATTHFQLTVRHGKAQVKIGSSIKGISKLQAQLLGFESAVILPAAVRRIKSGETVKLAPFEFKRHHVTYGSRNAETPLPEPPVLRNGHLQFQMKQKPVRVALKNIWNPLTCLHLLTSGTD